MRLLPAAPITLRELQEPLVFKGYSLPRGTRLAICIICMHHDQKFFADPDKYRPERFMPGNPENESRPKNAFLPFGLGPRNCLGYRFALLQALWCLAVLLPRVKFDLDERRRDEELQLKVTITMAPKDGVWLKAVRR